MKKNILLFLLLNIGQAQAHSLSNIDREYIYHTHGHSQKATNESYVHMKEFLGINYN